MIDINLRKDITNVMYILLGVLMASIGLKGFLLPNDFLDGGAMGIALLIKNITNIDISLLIVLINLPFILIGIKQVSVKFAIKSAIAILVLALFVHFIEIPTLTQDKLLVSVFGGFFLGSGIGLTIRGSAVIDGTEVLAISVSRKSSLSVGDFIALFNIVLFIVATILIDIQTGLYSMLTYISASKTVDFILNGIEEYIGVMIVSNNAVEIKKKISYDLRRGVTVFKSDEGFEKEGTGVEDKKILFCVITRLEITRLLHEIEKIDDKAFIVQYPIKDTKGGMIKRRPLH
ncbi:MAG: YitT family protein [Flavobacteriaceae bacterium]|nr:YitT family protein [Flavobacteriaceae bacterium]